MRIRIALLTAFALVSALFIGGAVQAVVPTNDSFASPTIVPAAGGPITGTNVAATGEAGEPNHANASLGSGCTNATTPSSSCENSVWYRWTPTTSEPYTIELCESTYDTTVGVYTGATVNALTAVGSNDNGETACPANHTASRVTFTTVASTAYSIAVAGYKGATGTIDGNLEPCTAVGANCPAPSATTGAATNLTGTGATLNGTVNPQGQDTMYHFDYGTAPDALSTSTTAADAGSDSSDHAVNTSISSLTPGTKYYFQIVAINNATPPLTTKGSVLSFTTKSAPSATTGAATAISGTGATLNGTVNPNGSPTTYVFQYGLSAPAYGSTTTSTSAGSGTSDQPASATISSLTPGTTYHYKIVAQNAAGPTSGADMTFKTLGPPTATTNAASPVTPTGATLNATINPQGQATTYHFEYGTDMFYGTNTPSGSAGSDANNHPVSANITGLSPSTTYHFRVVASNATGTTAGADQAFTTLAPNQKPAVSYPTPSATAISTTGATLNGIVNPEGVATTYQFEYGLVMGVYGTTTPASPGSVGSDSTNHPESASITGLTSGQTYHFRLNGTNANGTTNGADQSFIAEAPPTATTTAATNVIATTATLNGTVNAQGHATSYYFEYGLDTSYGASGSPTATTAVTPVDSNSHSASANITGLTPSTTYHFRVVATNGQSVVPGADMTFTTHSVPSATTSPATGITTNGATLHGTINPHGLATVWYFEYGTTMGLGSTTTSTSAGSGASDLPESAAVSGLASGTTYYFRITASSSAGTTSGSILNFATPTGPTATTGAASAVNTTTATLNGTVNPAGQATSYHFEYGTDTFYGTSTASGDAGAGSNDVAVSALINGLTPGTLYHFRLVATNGSGTTNGGDQTFTTAASGSPIATTQAATAVSATGATLNGTVNPQGSATTSHFDWGTSPDYGFTTPTVSVGSDSTSHAESASLTRLVPGTTYHYRIEATNGTGTTFGNDVSFVAAVKPVVSTTKPSGVDASEATLNGKVNPQGLSTTYFFEWATSTAYENVTPTGTLPADSIDHTVSADLSDLTPGTVYHYRLVATNGGGTSTSPDAVVEPCAFCKDSNIDGAPDILYRNRSTGHTQMWFMGGTNGVVKQSSSEITPDSHGFPATAWIAQSRADFNRDGVPDILYWNSGSGSTDVWFMGGTNGIVKQSHSFVSPGTAGYPRTAWVPVSTADFDGDGQVDILYWNRTNGATDVWFMGGTNGVVKQSHSFVSPGTAGYPRPVWHPVATADFNADGVPDILYWNSSSGSTDVWFMGGTNGVVKQSHSFVSPGTAGYPRTVWVPVSVADFNLDGVPDILYWNSSSGSTDVWFMGGTNGVVKESHSFVSPGSAGYPRSPWIPTD